MNKNQSLEECIIDTINTMVLRMTSLQKEERVAVYTEFKEWIQAFRKRSGEYDLLYLKKIDNYKEQE